MVIPISFLPQSTPPKLLDRGSNGVLSEKHFFSVMMYYSKPGLVWFFKLCFNKYWSVVQFFHSSCMYFNDNFSLQ